jgi:flagellar L-ring protein precursor FlgH
MKRRKDVLFCKKEPKNFCPSGCGLGRAAGFISRGCLLLLLPALAACGSLQKLSEIGTPPAMTATRDPTSDPKWRPVTMPMPHAEATPREPASLWRTGSRAFFRDQRAAQVGDIVTVLVNTADTADMENGTTATRTGSETMGLPNLFGLEGVLPKLFTKVVSPASLVNSSSTNSNVGTGVIKRTDTVVLRLAGVVTQVLPNGNLVISATQEMRVNSELRVLTVSGVIRPQDIASDNTVSHDRMAEARISYGGRGTLTDLQQPRYGQQAMDVLLPF